MGKYMAWPWRVRGPSNEIPPRIYVVSAQSVGIYNAPLTEETKANAHLIAAAPELYEACKMAIEATGGSKHWQGETKKFLLAMESALAKAEGRKAAKS